MSSRSNRAAVRLPGDSKSWLIPLVVAALLVVAAFFALSWVRGGTPKNILLLGVDQDKTRSDVVLLAHVDPRQGLANLISIPRDTWVEIPCEGIKFCQSPDKLNHAHVYGGDDGPELVAKTVERFLGIKVDGYVRVDFDGFKEVIDKLGGVDIVIDKDMDYVDPTPGAKLEIHFKASKEPQHLNGKQALEFVRYRNDGQGDVGRTERQRKFFMAVLQTMQKNGTASKLPGLVTAMAPYVKTDIDSAALVAVARMAPKLDESNLQMAMVPGTPVILKNGPWVWEVDKPKTQAMVDALIKNPKPADKK